MIELRQVSKIFPKDDGRIEALSAVDLSIARGEFVIILGPSGCGKSTLLRIVAGLEEPSDGEALFEGEPIAGPSRRRGMVFQSYSSFPWLTVQRNVEFGLRHHGIERAERSERASRLIEMVGLQGFEESFPNVLSGGMQQRLAIARTLAVDPEVLLLDEPFGALDPQTRQTLQEQLLSVQRETGKTVVFVTHDIDEALVLGSRILVLSQAPARVISDEQMSTGRIQSREYLLTEDFIVEKRKYARLLETRKIDVALSEWPGHAPTLYALDEGFVPQQIEVTTGLTKACRESGLISGEFDCVGMPLVSAIGLVARGAGKIVFSDSKSVSMGTTVLVIRKDVASGLEHPTDARLAIAPQSLEHMVLVMMLRSRGVEPTQALGDMAALTECDRASYVDRLLGGHVDAALLREPAISDLFASDRGGDFAVLETGVDMAPLQHVYVASCDIIERRPHLLLAYLKFVVESHHLYEDYEQEALATLHSRRGGSTHASPFVRSPDVPYYLFENVDYSSLESNVAMYLKGECVSVLNQCCEIAFQSGVLERIPDAQAVADFVEPRFIRQLAADADLGVSAT